MLNILFFLPFVLVYIIFVVYAERKVSAFIQDRLGPMETGKFGLLQTIADLLKLVQKEAITPSNADKILFALAPFLFFVAVFSGFAFIPLSHHHGDTSIELSLLFLITIISLDILGILAAGWGSNNKYALFGAIRSVAQIISYEIPLGISILCIVVISQSMDLQSISLQQGIFSSQTNYFLGIGLEVLETTKIGGFLTWNIFRYPILAIVFVIFFIASLAEANRTPFDLPEAESELIAGFHTEYTGVKFAILMLAEYAMLLLMSLLLVILFLGAWNSPLPNIGILKFATWTSGKAYHYSALCWGIFWLFSKTFCIIFLKMWIRWTYPRLRIDQLMTLCWKYLTPFSLICLLICSIWKLMLSN
jgi:NADH-quinone oxidoreductase subunit H